MDGEISPEVPGISSSALPQRKRCPVCRYAEGRYAAAARILTSLEKLSHGDQIYLLSETYAQRF